MQGTDCTTIISLTSKSGLSSILPLVIIRNVLYFTACTPIIPTLHAQRAATCALHSTHVHCRLLWHVILQTCVLQHRIYISCLCCTSSLPAMCMVCLITQLTARFYDLFLLHTVQFIHLFLYVTCMTQIKNLPVSAVSVLLV